MAASALTGQVLAATDSTTGRNWHEPVTSSTVGLTDRPAQWSADARAFRCLGLRLWHHGSAHRGVHGDISRAISSLPFPGINDCDIHSDGPPQVSHNRSGAGCVSI